MSNVLSVFILCNGSTRFSVKSERLEMQARVQRFERDATELYSDDISKLRDNESKASLLAPAAAFSAFSRVCNTIWL